MKFLYLLVTAALLVLAHSYTDSLNAAPLPQENALANLDYQELEGEIVDAVRERHADGSQTELFLVRCEATRYGTAFVLALRGRAEVGEGVICRKHPDDRYWLVVVRSRYVSQTMPADKSAAATPPRRELRRL